MDPVDPTDRYEDPEEGSDHHSSDTESIDPRGGPSDVEDEVEVVPPSEQPVPAVAVRVERFVGSFQWLWIWKLSSLASVQGYKKKAQRKIGPKIDRFSGGRGGGSDLRVAVP